MSRLIKAGDVITPAPGDKHPGPKLHVLGVLRGIDRAWVIELARPQKRKPNRMRWYFRAPYEIPLSEFEARRSKSEICLAKFEVRPELVGPDESILETSSGKQKERWVAEFARRDERFALIEPLVRERGKEVPFLTVISDPTLSKKIAKRALDCGCATTTIYNLLHQYWALGGIKNALCTAYWRCGSPGISKDKLRAPGKRKKKLGRSTRRGKAGLEGRGYVCGPTDHENIRWCYRRIKRGLSPTNAYSRMCQMHYSDRTVLADGRVVHVLWDPLQRPTKSEFLYWGKKLNGGKSVSRIVLGEKAWQQTAVSRGGSVQDQVTMAGQLANYDSTSTDKYYSSSWSRLEKLPPAWRLLLRDVRSEVIIGMDVSWEPPSQTTALRCLLHAATSKVDFCARFNIKIDEDDWPAMFPITVQADHGEMKGELTAQCEAQFGFSMDYVPTASGDRKGGVETQHRTDHKKVDHQAPGTTKGRPRRHGEPDPVASAGWNYYEAMQEYIEAVIEENNKERPEIAPAVMLRDHPRIRPTRLNILRFLREHGLSAELPCNAALMRTFMLPAWNAVIRANGVHLKATVDGYERVLLKMRYTSKQLVASGLLSKVKQSGKTIEAQVRLDENALRHAWLITGKGAIPLELANDDTILRDQTTLRELCMYMHEDDLVRDGCKGKRDQALAQTYERREQKAANARSEARMEEKALGKKPGVRATRESLRPNRVKQTALLTGEGEGAKGRMKRQQTKSAQDAAAKKSLIQPASNRVMDAFNARRG